MEEPKRFVKGTMLDDVKTDSPATDTGMCSSTPRSTRLSRETVENHCSTMGGWYYA